jgi:hypothetical protein
MANMVFQSPVTANWLGTINMTLCHVHPDDADFNIRTMAQSGTEVLELGILAYPSADAEAFNAALASYLMILDEEDAVTGTYTFDFLPNAFGFPGPFTTYYAANGGPETDGSEAWKVYMAVWSSSEDYEASASSDTVSGALGDLKVVTNQDHSSIDLTTRSTSKVCCKAETHECALDPEECNVGVLGYGDTWAPNCAQCPKPCWTDYGVCSMLATQTCFDIGGKVAASCDDAGDEDDDAGDEDEEAYTGVAPDVAASKDKDERRCDQILGC